MSPISFRIDQPDDILSPGLVIFREAVEHNLAAMIRMAGGAARLRPHAKTHKMTAIAKLELELGITKHKCATLAEAEMLAAAGVPDILLAYNLVGPNIRRAVEFVRRFPQVNFMVTADDARPISELSAAMQSAGGQIGVMLDLDSGMHRTGIRISSEAVKLYRHIQKSPGLIAAGLHVYDGHHVEQDFELRAARIATEWQAVELFREQLLAAGLTVPRIVASGTPGFPVHAQRNDATLEVSPGTTVFYDAGSVANFPDLRALFQPAAFVLSRVVSRPAVDLVTFDAGSKSLAADPPVEKRAFFLEILDAQTVGQSEEHLVIRTSGDHQFSPGDWTLIMPWHVCPTVALHSFATIISDGHIVDRWPVTARDRVLSF